MHGYMGFMKFPRRHRRPTLALRCILQLATKTIPPYTNDGLIIAV